MITLAQAHEASPINKPGRYYLPGNYALAEGALDVGCRFYAGYPITPSSEIMERMVVRLPEVNGTFIQMEDEIASIASVIGASWAGAKAMTATSGPGLSLMIENIGYAIMTETPCVIAQIQRAGPSTGQSTKVGQGDIMQVRYGASGDYEIIALSPSSPQEMYDMAIRAFNLAEQYRVPVFIVSDEAVAHTKETVVIPEKIQKIERYKAKGKAPFYSHLEKDGTWVPPMPTFGEGEQLLVTGSTHDAFGFRKANDPVVQDVQVRRLSEKILASKKEIVSYKESMTEEADYLLIGYGFTARAVMAAAKTLRENSYALGTLKLNTLWPLDEEYLFSLMQRFKKIFFAEMNLGQMARVFRQFTTKDIISITKVNGQVLGPKEIVQFIQKELL